MKRIEQYLFEHPNGVHYFIRKQGGTFDRRSLRTKDLGLARQQKAKILAEDYGEEVSNSLCKPVVGPQVIETTHAPTLAPVVKPSLYKALEQHRQTLPWKSKSTYNQHRTAVENVKRYCPDRWDEFHPTKVWNSYSNTPTVRSKGKNPDGGANHLRDYLRKFVPWAVRRGWLPPSDTDDVSAIPKKIINPRKIKVPESKEIEDLMLMCEEENLLRALYIRFILATGARKSGALFLRWAEVDLDRECFTLLLKGGREPTFDLNPDAIAVLKRIRDLNLDQERVFPMTESNARSALNMLKKYADALNVDLKILHAGRHIFASLALQGGFTPQEVAEMLGHRDGGVLVMRTYGHLIEKSYKKKIKAFRPISGGDEQSMDRAA